MLQLAGRLDKQRDVDPWVARFSEFDLDRDGVLTMNDVRAFEQQSSSKKKSFKNCVNNKKKTKRKLGAKLKRK
jgi:hypothetical protein